MKYRLIILLLLFSSVLCNAQKLPMLKGLKKGKLDNGLTYYIYNTGEGGKIQISMLSKIGYLSESIKERGHAHFLEHMMFNGSKNYPDKTCLKLFADMGMRIGKEFVAFTSSTSTRYNVFIPAGKPQYVDNCMLLYRDWMTELTLDPKMIEKEKGIVCEEINRGGMPPMALLNGSVLEGYTGLGTKEQVNSITHESLKRFYKKNYRPDLLSVFVIGELNEKFIERKIKEIYGEIPKSSEPLHEVFPDITSKNVIDPNGKKALSGVGLQIIFKQKDSPVKTKEDFKMQITERVFAKLIESRLSNSNKNSFRKGNYKVSKLIPGYLFKTIEVTGQKEPDYSVMLEDLSYKLAQIYQYGFSEEEVKYYSDILLKEQQTFGKNFDVLKSVISKIRSDFSKGDTPLDKEYMTKLFRENCKKLKSSDFKPLVDRLLKSNITVAFKKDLDAYSDKFTEDYIWSKIYSIDNIKTEPYVFKKPKFRKTAKVEKVELEVQPAKAAKLISKKKIDNNLSLLEYSNGIKVLLNNNGSPTTEIKVVGKGGLNQIPVKDRALFSGMQRFLTDGFSKYSSNSLEKYRRTINMTDKCDYKNYSHVVSLKAKSGNFPEMCKYFNLFFTDPKIKNKEEYQRSFKFASRFIKKKGNGGLYGKLYQKNLEIVFDTTNIESRRERLFNYNKDILRNFSSSIIYIGGDIPRNAEKFVTKYISSIPCSNISLKTLPKDESIILKENMDKNIIWKRPVCVADYFFNKYPEKKLDMRQELILEAIADYVKVKIIDIIREKHGLVYATGTTAAVKTFPHNYAALSFRYMIDIDKIERSKELMLGILNDIVAGKISDIEIERMKSSLYNKYNMYYFDDKEVNEKLLNLYLKYGKVFSRADYSNFIESISKEDILKTIKDYITLDKYYFILRRPK